MTGTMIGTMARSRPTVCRQLLICTLLILCVPAMARAEERLEFDIAAQPLVAALKAFAEQANMQLLYKHEAVERASGNAVVGSFDKRNALEHLLRGTGLEIVFTGEDAATIRPKANDSSLRRTSMTTLPDPTEIRLAQSEQSAAADTRAAAGDAQATPVRDVLNDKEDRVQLEEMVVTGSRLRRPNDSGPAPVVVFDRQDIERLGVTSVSDVLEYLPQQTFSSEEGFGFGGSRAIQLRGLGYGTTLILINGRRTVTSALTSGRNYFDMNSIPLAAVDRVEILSDSASAVYGADAVGGVVNVILKSGITEPTAELYYGTADDGADERRASLSYGHATHRMKGSIVLDYFERDALLGEDRDFYANRDFRRFGSTDQRVATSNPGNICSADGSLLTGLPTSCAAVPVGSTGVGLTPASFLATAGQTNMQTTSTYSSVIPAAVRRSAFATGELAITEQMTAFAELFYTNREEIRTFAPPVLNNTLVPATNPFNPFGEAVRVRYLMEGLGTQDGPSTVDSRRAVAGLEGVLGSWDWEVSGLVTDEDATDSRSYTLDMARVTASLNSTDPAQSLNVFQDGPGGSPELLAQFAVPDPNPARYNSRAVQGSAFVRGSIASLPGGPLDAVLGVETRTEEMVFHSSVVFNADRRSTSAFTELGAPLVDDAMDIPWVRRLALTLAARYDHYDDFGGTTNPQYGIEWNPASQLLLRASYGTSFRAPSLFELRQPLTISASTGTVFDPRRNETATGISVVSGGNDQLEPEESDSLTLGFVFTPGGPESDVRLAASYWRIEQDQRVQRLQTQTIMANEATFPERVIRDPPTALDVAAGRPGAVRRIVITALNFGALRTDGVDLEISDAFTTRLGRFRPSLAATWIDDFIAADIPNTPALDRVGVANLVQGSIVRWKARATLAWEYRRFGLTTNARYTSSYEDSNTIGTPTGRMLPAQTLVDLQASMDFGRGPAAQSPWLRGFVLRAGVMNLFDKGPPFSTSGGLGYDTYQSDIRQRFAYLALSKTF